MHGRGGMALLAALIWLAASICLPDTGMAADPGGLRGPDWQPYSVALAASSSLDAQTLGEKPPLSSPNKLHILGINPGLESDQSSGASLKLPHNLELNVSFLYNREAPSLDPKRHGGSLPLFNYSMDYHFLPNFKVGLSGYLYHPLADQTFSLNRPFGDRVMGLGPGIKYDLGRWSFVVKSQIETGTRDRGEDFQNWLRVWYAF
jgi:hypothetical protein